MSLGTSTSWRRLRRTHGVIFCPMLHCGTRSNGSLGKPTACLSGQKARSTAEQRRGRARWGRLRQLHDGCAWLAGQCGGFLHGQQFAFYDWQNRFLWAYADARTTAGAHLVVNSCLLTQHGDGTNRTHLKAPATSNTPLFVDRYFCYCAHHISFHVGRRPAPSLGARRATTVTLSMALQCAALTWGCLGCSIVPAASRCKDNAA